MKDSLIEKIWKKTLDEIIKIDLTLMYLLKAGV